MKSIFKTFLILILLISNSIAFERTVLAEIFTSTTCPPCATQNPYFDSWLKNYSNKDRVAVIKYHTWWPSPGNDPFYLANVNENRGRTNYYSTNYVPRGIINGTADGQSSAGTWIVLIQNTINSTSQFDVKIYGNVDANLGGNLTIRITADNNPIPSSTLVLQVAVVESDIHYTGTNGDPVHNFVMRKMYPDNNGETFTINPNETITFTRVFNWNSSWNLENSQIVAFIQNPNTKEVYQAAIRRANIYLATPAPIYPPNNSLNQPINITLKWNKISQATNYGLEVATDSLFSNKIFSDTTLTDTFKTLVKLQRETRYYWRVKAISSYAVTDWSEIYSFKTLPQNAPTQVQLVSPTNDTTIINPQIVQFNWLPSEPDVDYYRFELASDSNFSAYILDTIIAFTSLDYDMTFKVAVSYYWRVTAHNGVGWGIPSNIWKFKFLKTIVDETNIPDEFRLNQNYPNPFNPTTKIEFSIPQDLINVNGNQKVILKVFDLLGNEVAILFNQTAVAGNYQVNFDAQKYNLSSGVYFYQLSFGENVKIKKMIYLR